jgi:putative spermidine/putrescine transport system permease protein
VGLADAYASLRIEVGSAYTLVFFVILIPLLVALQYGGAGNSPGTARRPPHDEPLQGRGSSAPSVNPPGGG